LSARCSGFCATLCHAKVGVKVPPERVKHNGKDMPHREHLEHVPSCTTCHTFGAHKDVKFKGDKSCLECHEEKDIR
jgi:hypothetical protein